VVTNNCTSVSSFGDDVGQYIELCRQGQIYERLLDLVGWPRTQENRTKVKRLFFAVAYGDARDGNTKVGRAFQAAFPRCWDAVCRLKRGGNGRGGLARSMQTVESWTVIWRVGHRIISEFPTAPLFTLHDSLVTTEEFIGPFREVMEDEFRKVWGVVPQFTRKPFAET
jgi:hypothetical protein